MTRPPGGNPVRLGHCDSRRRGQPRRIGAGGHPMAENGSSLRQLTSARSITARSTCGSLEVGRIVAERNLAGGARVYCVGDRRRDKCPVGTQHGRQGRIQYVEQAKFTLRSGGAIDMPTAELTPPRCWSPVELRPKSVALRSRRPLGPCNPTGRAPSGFVSRRCSSTRCPRTRRERSMSSPASSARVGRTLQQPAGVHVELIAGARTYGVGCPSTLEYREAQRGPEDTGTPQALPCSRSSTVTALFFSPKM